MAAKKKPQFDAYGLWQSIIKENQDLARAVSSNNRVESEEAMVAISALYVAKSREVYGEDAIPLPEGVPIDVQKKIIACIEGNSQIIGYVVFAKRCMIQAVINHSGNFLINQTAVFEQDLRQSRRITLQDWTQRPWWTRSLDAAATLLDSQL